MIINFKGLISEGYSFSDILEAVHINHKELNKKNPGTKENRTQLAKEIKGYKKLRDEASNLAKTTTGNKQLEHTINKNGYNNLARAKSNGGLTSKLGETLASKEIDSRFTPETKKFLLKNLLARGEIVKNNANVISPAKK